MKLLFKFDANATDTEIQDVLKGLSQAGASRVYRLFKTTKNPELASIYGLRCAKRRAKDIQGMLDESSIVEYTESPVVRTLKPSDNPNR